MTHIDKKIGKRGLLLVLLAFLLVVGIGSTIAYIALKTPKITNEFVPAKVTCLVEEEFTNGVKSNVCVRNTGNVSAYMRAAIVVNWVNDNDGTVLSNVPVEGTDYSLTLNNQGWEKGKDGYYYYVNPVEVGLTTSVLITEAEELKSPDGYSLSIHVLASAIQSEPSKAVEQSWNVKVSNGIMLPTR